MVNLNKSWSERENVSILNYVKKVEHSARKQHICDFCGKIFLRTQHFQRHIRFHKGDKPYKCKMCEYSSVQKCDLKRHIKARHAIF